MQIDPEVYRDLQEAAVSSGQTETQLVEFCVRSHLLELRSSDRSLNLPGLDSLIEIKPDTLLN